jgi:acyl-CoA thioester hydrolase
MYISETTIRVRYAETDQMGYVYYGNYAQYFEVGRVEGLRQLGMSYRSFEESGIILPVLDLSVKFFKPAFYDDLLTIKTTIPEMPKVRIKFLYETYNAKGDKLNAGETTLVFIDQKSNKPCAAPNEFIEKIGQYFK